MVRIYLVRHGEAQGNVQEFFQGHIDTDISEKGRKQLECLAERFKDIPIEAVYSSPLRRAFSTAEAVNRHHGFEIKTDAGLMEINGGKWEGVKWTELPERFPDEYMTWCKKINEFHAPGGESTGQVYDRISGTMKKIASENNGRTIAVVSHGLAIKAYLTYAAGLPWCKYEDPGWADNTAVSLIEYDDELVPRIIFKNDSSHLTDELSTLKVSKWCEDTKETGE